MDRKEIIHGLTRLGEELKMRGLSGELLLTGGAAMCLVHSARDATRDIDALYEPKNEIAEIAAIIAREEGYPEGWVYDAVKG